MAVGIKVVRGNGERLTKARAFGRYWAMLLSSFTLGIGFLMAAFTERKQGLHDMVCDTSWSTAGPTPTSRSCSAGSWAR